MYLHEDDLGRFISRALRALRKGKRILGFTGLVMMF